MLMFIEKRIKYFIDLYNNKSIVRTVQLLLCICVTIALSSSCSVPKNTSSTPIPESTQKQILAPTQVPTQAPTKVSTKTSTPIPEQEQTITPVPTPLPTQAQITTPTSVPTQAPTAAPTPVPTQAPTAAPTPVPTQAPTVAPTPVPTKKPTVTPIPTPTPTQKPEPTSYPKDKADSPTAKAKNIIQNIINEDMEDVEKVNTVHDYIIENTRYDIEGLENNNISSSSYSAEGVLFEGKAVCQGYAEAFQLFMELLNIESKIVYGTDLVNGISHAWNMVCLNDKWYHIDATWDDPVSDQGDVLWYKYFLVRDEDMAVDHQWKGNDYPECSSADYLYYIYKDYIVDSIDNVEETFMEQYDKGLREITLLYTEEGVPDFSFMYNYEYLNKNIDEGELRVTYYLPWRLGDYYVLTVIVK